MSWLEETDLAPCGAAGDIPGGGCGKDVTLAYEAVCGHGHIACPECGHETVCRKCKEQAERDMFASGEWNPKADPLYDHTAPPYNPAPLYHLAGGEWVRSDPMEGQR